ncbi:MAG: hypothetical protein K0R55_1935 [Sporomusa sp.]|jgi:hypothetical protein|nr:hypothetical protein [Sporomusa sp.]
MKKKILTLLTGTMLVASVGMAAPLTDLQKGETNIGYNHYNLDASGPDYDNDSFYLEHAVGSKVIVGLEKNTYAAYGDSIKSTDIYAHYKLDPNVRLILGNRDYNGGDSKVFYGIGASTNLAPKLDGYASVITNSDETEWTTGLAYKLTNKTNLHLGYKSNKLDGAPRADGLGFGVNYKF